MGGGGGFYSLQIWKLVQIALNLKKQKTKLNAYLLGQYFQKQIRNFPLVI